MPPTFPASAQTLTDAQLAGRVAGHDHAAFEFVMRRHNAMLFRVARAILRDDADAEDALQEAYLAAYRHMADFRGDARLSTWLTRIVINQAYARLRARKRDDGIVPFDPEGHGEPGESEASARDAVPEPPERAAMRAQIRRLLEQKIDELPLAYRTVFVLREVEEMTVDETAACLSIPEATVRTRLFRARARLRESLARELDTATVDVFGFAGARCDRIVAGVLARLDEAPRIDGADLDLS